MILKSICKKSVSTKIIGILLSMAILASGMFCPVFSDRVYAASISLNNYQLDTRIRLNSIGYLPGQEKRATIAATCTDFIIAKGSGEVVLTGKTTSMYNTDTSEQVSIADFSSVNQDGTYCLVIPGVGKSIEFRIGKDVYVEPFKTTMLGMYLWRCGTAVSATYNGKTFSHQACHTKDAYMDYINGQHTITNGLKGWHDAGDYNKYVVNAGVTVGTMLLAWEQFKDKFEKIKLTMPESSNSIPDYLDEIKYETDWLLTMQYPDGRVSHKLSTKNFGAFALPEYETTDRYFTSWGSAATADFVAMLAMASRAFRPYDAAYADKCINAAKVSYKFLLANKADTAPDQSAFTTGGYDTTDPDDRLWAAAEMWETLGDSSYLSDFESRANSLTKKINPDLDWGDVGNLGMFTYLLSTRTGKNQGLYEAIKSAVISAADSAVNVRNSHGYGRPYGSTYYWGCNGAVARQTTLLQIANKLSPKSAYTNTALDAIGFLFGRNYYDRSFVTGIGVNPPMHPHDRRSGGDSITEPWPGYLVGGGFPGAKDWVDIQDSYQTNEIAINWNGALIYAMAGFVEDPASTVGKYGDVDGSGVVDSIDYALLKQYLLGQISSFPGNNGMVYADVNLDNNVDALDLALVKQYLLGSVNTLPVK